MVERRLSCAGLCVLIIISLTFLSCSTGTAQQPPSLSTTNYAGVLMWKGDPSNLGLYSSETTLTPANVNVNQFGKLGTFQADGIIMGQPLYVSNVSLAPGGTHNLIIVVTENDSVYAIDADNPSGGSLWERHYLDATNGITPLADSFCGGPVMGGEVGISGTPYIDSSTGALYFVSAIEQNGVPQQWLRSIDITSGKDFGAGSVQVQASVPGDGKGTENGQIAFDPSLENQRAGLTKVGGAILVGWGSFSDCNLYHGWLMAFDPSTLNLLGAFNSTTQSQPVDVTTGPSSNGGAGSFWQGGAAPAVDSSGNIYVDAANGSFNADQGGNNYGDTLLKLTFSGSSFQIADWFTPSNADCYDEQDLELGSGGVALLPSSVTNGANLAFTFSKEGRLFVVNMDTLGHYNAGGDNLIPQEFMIGNYTCDDTVSGGTEGPVWNRLYGDASYWNGNLYAGASNLQLKQYQFQNGLLDPTPVETSPTAYGSRGANTVVSANGNQNGIVWAYEKANSGLGVLHAYDATNVSNELWNSGMNQGRDGMGEGIGFATPVVVDGHVIAAYNKNVVVYGELSQ
ncbi:MAG TPA: hypothetical protein VMG31_14825 [Verrucomicrobiae bacterium]|nr:hypothetical protein [Verrucomicrobiae bacterium]